jgi:short-subunit dehydrogenase
MANSGIKNEIKWALVTGASSGIGKAFAQRIALEGYNVVLVARRERHLKELAHSITEASGVDTVTFAKDLHKQDSITEIFSSLTERRIHIDVLFNNAGYGINGEFCDIDVNRQLQMIDLNCKSLVMLSHQISNQMRDRGCGSIIHTASLGGLAPTPFFATYGATKAFIISFSEALGEELRPYGVRVLTLCPGATATEFEKNSNFRGMRPSKAALESAEDVAETAVRALKKSQSLVVSGRHNQLAACLLKSLPRHLSLRFAARAMRPNHSNHVQY